MKHVPERVRRYGLRSQRRVPYFKSRDMLKESGFVLPDWCRNCVFTNSGSETTKHWVVKSIIFKILRDRRREVGTEVEVNGGIVDVLDVDNMIAYEVESNLTPKKLNLKLKSLSGLRDIFFIDVIEVPDDVFEADSYLKQRII